MVDDKQVTNIIEGETHPMFGMSWGRVKDDNVHFWVTKPFKTTTK